MFTDVVAPAMNFKYNFTFTNDERVVFSSVGDGRYGKAVWMAEWLGRRTHDHLIAGLIPDPGSKTVD